MITPWIESTLRCLGRLSPILECVRNCVYQCAKNHGIQITRPWHNLHKNEIFAPKLKNQYSPRLPMYYFVGPSREQHILSLKIKIFSLYPECNNPWIFFVKGNIRENPLTKRFYHPHTRNYSESSRLHTKAGRLTPGSGKVDAKALPQGGDTCRPRLHSAWASSSPQGQRPRHPGEPVHIADTIISPSSACVLPTTPRYTSNSPILRLARH